MEAKSKPQLRAYRIDGFCKKYNSIRIYHAQWRSGREYRVNAPWALGAD
jgi:hypothetical protein